ncbi:MULTISPECIES: DEAD/DEAH box helicase [unclassified Pedobacter]|uniref:DEAD/DEAH box helicase n=1 Tax=unclassified Pedobacter TaxID=2628915 RepID=UPI0014209652|nr:MULTISPECIES: DEAD/DEAH box helicase family protein [unclassified Pedobacter]NII81704.1 superfamily II DNA or RNA helicase [Pedobacter sp. SG908]NMN35708.1 superfamily II DNA or RNA helicase [Pedobacter sp. SG918]
MQLRTYQSESIFHLREGFANKHQRQVLTLPTGAGKTVVFCEMARMAHSKGTVTLILTDRTELFKQTIKSLNRVGITVEEISPNKKHIYEGATVYLGMVETLKRRKNLSIEPNLIIIDESHKGNFTSILEKYPNAKVIGATATPVGNHFFKYYQNIVQVIDVPELVSRGYLVKCKAYQMQDDFSDLETKSGEYTDYSLLSHFDKAVLYDGVIDWWKKYAMGLKTICFNVNIEHTIKTHQAFVAAGISSEYVTSKTTKEERDRILAAFTAGHFQVLNNCGILTTGYDEPTISCVIMNRATKSLPLFLQCVGRGSRALPGVLDGLSTDEERLAAIASSAKPHFILLDFGMNHDRHGMWNEPRLWKLKEPKEKQETSAPVKKCGNEECECLVPISARECNFCGYVFHIAEAATKEGVMVEVTPKVPSGLIGRRISDLTIDQLIELEKSKSYKSTFIWRVVRSMGKDTILYYANIKGYKKGWIERQMDGMDDCEYTDYKLIG